MILMNDFKLQIAAMRDEIDAAIDRVLVSGWFILGREVEAFEHEFAAFVEGAHGVGVGNGMDAIQLALDACGVGPGDEVITTPNSAFASALAIVRVGATPVFVDIDEASYALDVARVADAITTRTRAILPVHIYGQPVDLDPLLELAHDRGFAVVSDAAQAHGARHRGQGLGAIGDAAAFSFYPTKNLGAVGDGGMVVCADAKKASRVRCGRDYGQERRYRHTVLGINSRLDELQAAILRVKLRHLPAQNHRRRQIAALYGEKLGDLPLVLPKEPEHGEGVWHLYVIRTPQRDRLSAFLRERGIETLVHYPMIIPQQPAMASYGFRADQFPVAERCAREFLSLPIHPLLTDEQVGQVAQGVREFFAASAGS